MRLDPRLADPAGRGRRPRVLTDAGSPMHELSPRREAGRKAIHIPVALAAAVIAVALPPALARATLAAAAAAALLVDLARLYHPGCARAFRRAVGKLLRPDERHRLTGATIMAGGFALTALVFPPDWAATAFLYAGLADAAAALVGRRFGRLRTRSGASLEGSLAFFLTALVIGILSPTLPLGPAALAALSATILEAASPRRLDNLVVPFGGAAAIGLALHLFR